MYTPQLACQVVGLRACACALQLHHSPGCLLSIRNLHVVCVHACHVTTERAPVYRGWQESVCVLGGKRPQQMKCVCSGIDEDTLKSALVALNTTNITTHIHIIAIVSQYCSNQHQHQHFVCTPRRYFMFNTHMPVRPPHVSLFVYAGVYIMYPPGARISWKCALALLTRASFLLLPLCYCYTFTC